MIERVTVSVKCLAQENNGCPQPGLEPRLLDPKTSPLTMRPLCLPKPGGGV